MEERDTLQLRLSNALRMNEELRARARTSAAVSSPDKTANQSQLREAVPHHLAAVSLPPPVNVVVEERQEDLQALANK